MSKIEHIPPPFLSVTEQNQAVQLTPPAKPSAEVLQRAFQRLRPNFWPVTWVTQKGPPYLAHYHPVDEQLLMLAGHLEFWDVSEGVYYHVRAGDELFIPAGCVHCVRRHWGATYIMGLREPVDMDNDFFKEAVDMSDLSIALMAQSAAKTN